jgi:hypothetical protein
VTVPETLKGLTNLIRLVLRGTGVTDAGANELNQASPSLEIANSIPTRTAWDRLCRIASRRDVQSATLPPPIAFIGESYGVEVTSLDVEPLHCPRTSPDS